MILANILQLCLLFFVVMILAQLLGSYLIRVLNYNQITGLEFLFEKIENFLYRIVKINPDREQTGKEYLKALLCFNVISFIFAFFIFWLQSVLPLNPMKVASPSWHLSFNAAVSFMTGTNIQYYLPEIHVSYFTQMAAFAVQNFLAPCCGLCVATALTRSLSRTNCPTVGNFWRDLIRLTLYFFLPLSLMFSVFLISQGVPQNFSEYVKAIGLEKIQEQPAVTQPLSDVASKQIIVQGPIASQEAIKLLGSNGGGFTNTNSAHPYENPSPWVNFWQIVAILAIPVAQFNFFAREIKNRRHGRCLFMVMTVLFLTGICFTTHFEHRGNPNISKIAEKHVGNMEGKEMRFGVFDSSLYSITATAVANGSTNAIHTSYTPIGSLMPLVNMQMGEIIFGGVGSGLYNMIIFIILTIFLAGLIIGRTPEYLGKKFEAYEIKMSVFALIAFFVAVLGFTALAISCNIGKVAMFNKGPHGFTEVLYAFSASVANNGSSFAGLNATTAFYDVILGIAMLAGRFLVMIPMMMIAGSLVKKQKAPQGVGTFQVTGLLFGSLLLFIILLLGSLTFIPSVVMGPILEHFYMIKGVLF